MLSFIRRLSASAYGIVSYRDVSYQVISHRGVSYQAARNAR
jgi:hypothetical protein